VTGSVTFHPRVEDLSAAYALNMSRTWRKSLTRLLPVGLLFAAVLAISFYDRGPRHVTFVAAAMTIFVSLTLTIYAILRFIWLPRFSKRIYAQQMDLHEATEISWDAEGFTATNSLGRNTLPWANFHGWKRGDTMFLLFRSEAMFNFFPLTDPEFAAAADAMERLLLAAGVKEL
jgi:hypothetical protein